MGSQTEEGKMIDREVILYALAGIQEAQRAAHNDRVISSLQGMETALAWVVEMEGVGVMFLEKLAERGRATMTDPDEDDTWSGGC
jgi:hypothetical protein